MPKTSAKVLPRKTERLAIGDSSSPWRLAVVYYVFENNSFSAKFLHQPCVTCCRSWDCTILYWNIPRFVTMWL